MFVVAGGRALIDTTYVDNAGDALVVAAEQLTPDGPLAGRAFVVTNGEPLPLRTLLEQICAAAAVPPPARDLPLGVARGMAAAAERLWARARPGDEPPATRFLVSTSPSRTGSIRVRFATPRLAAGSPDCRGHAPLAAFYRGEQAP